MLNFPLHDRNRYFGIYVLSMGIIYHWLFSSFDFDIPNYFIEIPVHPSDLPGYLFFCFLCFNLSESEWFIMMNDVIRLRLLIGSACFYKNFSLNSVPREWHFRIIFISSKIFYMLFEKMFVFLACTLIRFAHVNDDGSLLWFFHWIQFYDVNIENYFLVWIEMWPFSNILEFCW